MESVFLKTRQTLNPKQNKYNSKVNLIHIYNNKVTPESIKFKAKQFKTQRLQKEYL